jgi:hypothetical protein
VDWRAIEDPEERRKQRRLAKNRVTAARCVCVCGAAGCRLLHQSLLDGGQRALLFCAPGHHLTAPPPSTTTTPGLGSARRSRRRQWSSGWRPWRRTTAACAPC